MTGPGVRMPSAEEDEAALREAIRERLEGTRETTLSLVSALSDEQLYGQPENVMGVLAWDVGHIGFFEHRWLVDELGGDPVQPETAVLFDPFEHPRSERGQLDLPDRKGLRAYLDDVRQAALAILDEIDLGTDDRLTHDGFVHDMIVRHEDQHRENMLITLQLFGQAPQLDQAPDEPIPIEGGFSPSTLEPVPEPAVELEGMVEVPGGTFTLGQDLGPGVYDNEAPAHEVEIEPFEIDVHPVTNADYLAFLEDGGYQDPGHWSEDGWMIRQALDLEHPKFWTQIDGTWCVRQGGRFRRLPPDEPVVHVSYYEAEAYASWAGKRLPTEAEWEAAALWDPVEEDKRRFPWGDEAWSPDRANLGQRTHRPAPVGAYPEGVSAVGCHQMAGDVWEWTTTVFTGYPGFEAFPYPEYSEVHFDSGYQVLRGGSWATEPSCAHGTFRNWHQPDHQQLFAGFRCARETSA